jgi:type I restriction enzyme S subunit
VTSFPKYERYKDSGVEWLGEVPEHWESERVFSAFNERVETGHPDLPNLNITIGRGVQVEEFEGARKKRLIEDLNAYKRAAKGDIAYNTMRMWQGAVGDVPVDGLVSPAYVVARPIKPINSRFYSYLFRTETFQTETNRHSYGIVSDRNRLYWLGFKNITIPIPSREEQDRIVAFLDQKTAEIDALIAKKQRQIELLDEQKAILINRAVTRGLNLDAKLKSSGIEWIGEIPEHWETRQVRHLFDNLDNRRIPISSIERGKMTERLYDYYGASGAIDKVDGYIFDEDLILIAEDGANLVMRNLPLAIHATGKYWVNNHAHILRPKQGPIEYWLHALECCDFTTSITGSAQPKLTKDALASSFLPCPPVNEQHAIVAFLNQNREAEKKLRATITAQSDSLQTLRSTLIAHAVTGRIRV